MSADLPAGAPAPRGRPARRWRILALATAGVLAAVAGLLAAGIVALGAGAGAGPVRALLQAKLGRPVAFTHLAIARAPDGLRLVFTDLRVGQPASFGRGDLLRAPRLDVVVRVAPLLVGRLEAPEVALTSPELHLLRRGPGDSNYSFGKGGGASGLLGATRTLSITGGRVEMIDPQRHLTLQAAFSHDARVADLPLRLEGGGVLQGEPYLAQARGGRLNGRKPHAPHAVRFDMQDGAMRVRMAGITQAPFDFRGFDMDAQMSGPNLADLGYLFNLLAPNSPPFQLTGHMHRDGKRFAVTRLDARIGDSDLEGEITSDHLQRRRISGRLRSRRMTARDLRVMLASPPPHAVARGRAGEGGRGGGTRSGRLFSATPVSLRRLQGNDIRLDYRADDALGFGPPVSAVELQMKVEQGRLALAPLAFRAAGGAVRIEYRLDTAVQRPTAHLTGQIHGLQLARAGGGGFGGRLDADVEARATGLSVAQQAATADGRASLRLTGATLPKLDAAALSGDLFGLVGGLLEPKAKAPLRCAAADFAVAGGVARATRLVVGTRTGAATGGGVLDLRQERVDLKLEASSTGRGPPVKLRVPILVDGPLAKPHAHAKAPSLGSGASDLLHSLGRVMGAKPAGAPPPPC